MPEKILEICVLAYLLGSIPFGLLLTRAAGLGDVRAIGSGNIGATNVMRTGNKKLALLTLLLDMGKGYIAAWLGFDLCMHFLPIYFTYMMAASVIGVVLGHCYPVWLKFKGGKGVATALGAMFFLAPDSIAILIAVWLFVFALFRISSLAALVIFVALPYIALMYSGVPWEITLPVSLLIFWRHKDNIRRLLNGTEPKFGRSS